MREQVGSQMASLKSVLRVNAKGLAGSSLMRRYLVTAMLTLVLLMSALAVVYASHNSRLLYAEQDVLQAEHDHLQLEFAQLLLEQSAWSSPNRIEEMASRDLQMIMPDASQIEVVK